MTWRHGPIGGIAALLTLSILGHAAAANPPVKVKKTPARMLNSIRCSDTPLIDLFDQGLSRSSTMRDLESRLEGSSVIVYLSRALLPSGLVGRTRLIGAGGRWRFLLMEVDERIGPLDLLTAIGHELQHALEIADAADVVDLASLETLYRRIGRDSGGEHGNSHWYETRDAEETGRRVRVELTGWAWAPLARPTRHS